jgi:hypothetical protein
MRQMLGALVLGIVLTTAAVAAHANGSADLGLPPLDPMGGAAALAPADEPGVQQDLRPYQVVQHEENKDSKDSGLDQ